jgi:Na+/proline symporter/signal transduction histidine kinase
MLQGWVVVAAALGYIGSLFVIASYGDHLRLLGGERRNRLLIYPLSLAIYCTSWTFFGSVGLAARTGYDFLTIYIGPALMIGLATPLVIRTVRLAKANNITSIADFIAARYGKNQSVAATVALIAIVGTVPYVALQLKAVSSSLATILGPPTANAAAAPVFDDLALLVTLAMATFAVLFGTRHIDATEHQHGLILAIATESMVKLVAFVTVGIFVTFVMFDGPFDLIARAHDKPAAAAVLAGNTQFANFAVMTLLSLCAITLLPRQFHVTVVENNSQPEIRRAAWLFPLYLVLINLFVVPIAVAGLIRFPEGGVDSDMFVLALPLAAGNGLMALIAFIGGLSAATAMVIVESVALAIMVSNDLFVPLVLRRRADLITSRGDVGTLLLTVRRLAIFAILILAYVYYRLAGDAQLAAIGLLSFAAVAQLAPAFFGGLVWRRGTARGALAGMSAGILVWAYTLLLPSFADAGLFAQSILTDGPAGLGLLRPQALFGLDLPPLVHGVVCSLTVNIIAYIASSLAREPSAIEQVQADLFVPAKLAPIAPSFRLWRTSVTVEDLTTTVARYLGEERTRASFESFATTRRLDLGPKATADFELLRYAEHLLASAIGAASSRLVLSLLLRQKTLSTKAALKLLDDASAAIHYNREILQTALDHVRQGIAVFDKDMHLVCWNRQFGEVLNIPPDLVRIGTGIEDILSFQAGSGSLGPGAPDDLLRRRLARWVDTNEPFLERFHDRGLVIEVRANRMPDGGTVTTLTDITPSVEAAEALERSNETLERRVRERTRELERLNAELGRAKAAAEEANISKTRFLAAASHDILQPLNAARLYVTSLVERKAPGEESRLVDNVDASLEAVEEILGALLDISRLDTGAMACEIVAIRIDELSRQLELEFVPLAREKGLELTFVHSSLAVQSDRRLLRRLLQNLVSNAVKYTPNGRVLVGCRRRGETVCVDVYDTGIGIPKSKQKVIFTEFHRLEQGAKVARGLGLGLSIVERIARMLDHRIDLRSEPGRGSHFSVVVPLARTSVKEARRPEPRRLDRRQLTGLTVLCIDNEPNILDGMRALLGGWGCDVITAADADAAAAADNAREAIGGLVVDYHLDHGHGIELASALRERLGNPSLPAILITADRSPGVLDAARAHDMQVLHKPVKPAALRALLAQWRVRSAAAAE